MTDWQPIETAPKIPWRKILVCTAGDRSSAWFRMWKHNPRFDKTYWGDMNEWDDYDMVDNPPTHWLEIPEIPKGEE